MHGPKALDGASILLGAFSLPFRLDASILDLAQHLTGANPFRFPCLSLLLCPLASALGLTTVAFCQFPIAFAAVARTLVFGCHQAISSP